MSSSGPLETSPRSDAIVKWLVPDRVIYMWATGDVSPSVREWMNAQAVYLYHSCATPKIHILFDMNTVTSRPKGTKQDRPAVWHSRRGWIISVNAVRNPMLRMIINLLLRLLRLNYIDCPSIENGLDALQNIDPTLPDLKQYWSALGLNQHGSTP